MPQWMKCSAMDFNDHTHFILGVVGRKAFQAAVADFEKNTCIRFIKHTNEKAYIWVHRGSG